MIMKRNQPSLRAGLLMPGWSHAFVLHLQREVTQEAEHWCSRFPFLNTKWITDLCTESTGQNPAGVCGRSGTLPERLWKAPHLTTVPKKHSVISTHPPVSYRLCSCAVHAVSLPFKLFLFPSSS